MKHKIKHQFNCNGEYLIYLITCKQCFEHYLGQTIEFFKLRWNKQKYNDRKFYCSGNYMQEYLFKHFPSTDHNEFFSDASIAFIDKNDHVISLKRKKC